jgi:Holliday junction resolvasome RuvABC endonuclease subunit
MARVGLDISLNSTGIVLRKPEDSRLYIWFFQQRRREYGFRYSSDSIEIVCVPFDTDADKFDKITVVAQTLESVLDQLKPSETRVFIESYAFAATTSCLTQLAEIGGVLRWTLRRRKFTFEDVSPLTLKKHFTGSGRASKEDMYKEWIRRGYSDLTKILSLKRPTDKPAEDIIDAAALALYES